MLLRILLALVKTAAIVALYGFVDTALRSSPELSWILSVSRRASETTGMPYRDSVFLVSVLIAVSLYKILVAVGGVMSVRARRAN
jgi:hypothetical protein